jgi:hypothetical protein
MKKRLSILLGFGLFLLASCGNEVKTNTTKSKESTTETTSIQSTTESIQSTTEIDEFITFDEIREKYYQNNKIEFIEYWYLGGYTSSPYIFEESSNDEIIHLFKDYKMKKTTYADILIGNYFYVAPIFENYKWTDDGKVRLPLELGMACGKEECIAFFCIPIQNGEYSDLLCYSINIESEVYDSTVEYLKNLPKEPIEKYYEHYQ